MRIVKKFITAVFWLLIVALLVAPLGLIWQISLEEQAEFATPTVPQMQQTAVGGIFQSREEDLHESFTVSGSFVSETFAYLEVDYITAKAARWYVSIGDEIQQGQVLASGPEGEIISEVDGILVQTQILLEDCYLKIMLFTPVELSCRVDARTLSILKMSNMLTCNGAAVTLTYSSKQQNADGTTNVRIRIDSDEYVYGQVVESLYIYTGRTFHNVICVPSSCIYQKSDGYYYARQVTKEGVFIAEVKVEVIYSDRYNTYVTGIQGGEYFDSGYQIIAGG